MLWNLKKKEKKRMMTHIYFIYLFLTRLGACSYLFRVYEYNICMLHNEREVKNINKNTTLMVIITDPSFRP